MKSPKAALCYYRTTDGTFPDHLQLDMEDKFQANT